MIPLANEVNFDGLVGPTHNYGGLSFGNIASMQHGGAVSNPKEAALQGLLKMKFLAGMGIQGILPPHERPHIPTLRALGFLGTDRALPEKAFKVSPQILFDCSSASAMWAANAATVSPSIDSDDNKVHITPANLLSKSHRTLEAEENVRIFKAIFPSTVYFSHHSPLPYRPYFSDDGAANHTRFCRDFGHVGVQLFVYGIRSLAEGGSVPQRFPARQDFEASQTIARLHRLHPYRVVFAQQSPKAIDAGVFHNDVIAVGCKNLLFYHEHAFLNSDHVIERISEKVRTHCDTEMLYVKVDESTIPLKTAVETYLFNSQLISLPDGEYALVAPTECQTHPVVSQYLERLTHDPDNPVSELHFFNVRESMRNGGGPACLRLRLTLTENELNTTTGNVFLTDHLYDRLVAWVEKHYRDRLSPNDLADPKLVDETREALNALTQILDLGHIYAFQR